MAAIVKNLDKLMTELVALVGDYEDPRVRAALSQMLEALAEIKVLVNDDTK